MRNQLSKHFSAALSIFLILILLTSCLSSHNDRSEVARFISPAQIDVDEMKDESENETSAKIEPNAKSNSTSPTTIIRTQTEAPSTTTANLMNTTSNKTETATKASNTNTTTKKSETSKVSSTNTATKKSETTKASNTNTTTKRSETTSSNTTKTTTSASKESSTTVVEKGLSSGKYVLNINTKKFHYADCSSVKRMNEANKEFSNGPRDTIIERGFVPCKNCNP